MTIKKIFILQNIKKTATESGIFGEKIAKKWLEQEWEIIDVSSQDKPFFDVNKNNAKRPDFVSIFNDGNESDDKIILWDAKFHTITNNNFKLTDEELNKYYKLKELFCDEVECEKNDVHIIFMVLPKQDNGNVMYLVHLQQFSEGTCDDINGNPAKNVQLKNEDRYDTSSIQMEILEKYLVNE